MWNLSLLWVPLPTSLHFHLSFLSALLLFHVLLPFLSRPQTHCLLKVPPPIIHLPESWHYLSSLLRIFLPVASSPPSRTCRPLIHTTEGSISSKKRRQLTVPYAAFALRCATTFLCNWIISLAANLTSVVWGILPLLLFTSVWTYTFCCRQK